MSLAKHCKNFNYSKCLTSIVFLNYNLRGALLVQLVERRFPKPDVEGSSPSGRVRIVSLFFYFIVIYLNWKLFGEVAEWFKASDC